MVYTSDLEEYLRLRQILQPSSEKRNSHAETSDMQPPAPFAGQSSLPSEDWPLHDPSMSYASTFLDSSWTMPTQPPDFAIGHRTVPSTNWSLYDPSMSHASGSLHPGRTIHTAIGHPTEDNFYQSNMQFSSTMQYRDSEVGTEDHLSPGQTTTHTWSSTPSPSTQEKSPSNQHNEVANLESTSIHSEPQQQE
ncbi:hypothetical protein PENPOL_c002G00747 [Penicillium polonicum]|uniref:Uncharacterized protein n=1 Tax=Penicillium polonicum TaxID=60169 RepID=A0A1V6NZ34_PENPO|nr:hypothetical protein PENPOL_c002G00747 [Penicillium polonicum]